MMKSTKGTDMLLRANKLLQAEKSQGLENGDGGGRGTQTFTVGGSDKLQGGSYVNYE